MRTALRGAALLRSATLTAAAVAGTRAAWALARPSLAPAVTAVASDGPAALARLSFPTVIAATCAAALLLGCLWAVGVSVLLGVEACVCARTGRPARLSRRLSPTVVRRWVLGGCGAALTAGLLTAPAVAAPPAPGQGPAGALAGLPFPDRATTPVASAPAGTVVVAAGDTLWSIAERLLPPDASDYEVTAAWHLLHAANLGRIGPDPDLIVPGTAVRVPAHLEPNHGREAS